MYTYKYENLFINKLTKVARNTLLPYVVLKYIWYLFALLFSNLIVCSVQCTIILMETLICALTLFTCIPTKYNNYKNKSVSIFCTTFSQEKQDKKKQI